jgi:hypothetical protein
VARLVGRLASGRFAVTTGLVGCLGLPLAAQPSLAFPLAEVDTAVTMAGPALRPAARPPARPAVARPRHAAPAAAPAAADPEPVAGLSRGQMANAAVIVAVGRELGLPRRAYVIAIACALQESTLRNLASSAVPESMRHPHQGVGSDHDSVGLFQQRSSTGWGPVRDLMRPSYAARKFYLALRVVPGWPEMALTRAAQAVQNSAFPLAYAKHEARARQIVDALT